MDANTVRIVLKQPDSTIPDQLGQYFNGIVPVGYERKGALKWVGTGPYKLKSFTPGQQSVHVRNANYWRRPPTGRGSTRSRSPTSPTPTAQVNALLAGQLDAITDIPFAQIDAAKAQGIVDPRGRTAAAGCRSAWRSTWTPFTDVKVRQAFRLIADRQAMLEQVLSGHGRVANDLYSPFDACYSSDLPQREQDIEQAKSLLKPAGQDGLTVDLHTTNGAAGMVDSANVFASQARPPASRSTSRTTRTTTATST